MKDSSETGDAIEKVTTDAYDVEFLANTRERYSQWTIPGSGTETVSKLWYWDHDGSLGSGESITMAMYSGDGNSKLNDDVTISGTGNAGWLSGNVASPFEVTLGQTYYVGYTNENNHDEARDESSNHANYLPNVGSYYVSGSSTLDSTVPTGSQSGHKYGIFGVTYTDPLVSDSTTNNNDGNQSNPTSASGKVGNGQDFDAVVDYVDILNSVAGGHAYTSLSDAITVSAWIEPDAITGTAARWRPNYTALELRTQETTGSHVPFSFGVDNSKLLLGATDDYTTGEERFFADSTLSVDTMYHAAFTISGDDYVFYLNGSSDGSGTFVEAAGDRSVGSTSTNLQIGARSKDDGQKDANMFDGIIDEVRVSNSVRDASWISAEYNNQNSPGTFYTLGSEETE